VFKRTALAELRPKFTDYFPNVNRLSPTLWGFRVGRLNREVQR